MPVVYKLFRGTDKKTFYIGKSETEEVELPKEVMAKVCADPSDFFTEVLETTDKTGTDLLLIQRKYYDEYKPEWNTKKPICTAEEREQNEKKSRAFFYQKWRRENS